VPLSAFVGRKKELAELRRLFSHTRVLTLLGPGGAGKTRLAIEFAQRQAARFPDGVILVELGAVVAATMVADAMARSVGILLVGDDPLATLKGRLYDKHALLIIDNCEHLVAAAADTLAALLPASPKVAVLVTSRERLNLDGETCWRVPPMGLPAATASAEASGNADAVRLFVERARSVRPGFNLDATNAPVIAAICRRLDGIPLAIELAASRMRVLTPADILSRLDDRFGLLTGGSRNAAARHKTLRATVDWSYELLSKADKVLLHCVSIFAGDFTLDAAEAVCARPPFEPDDVVEGLARLVDRSMLQAQADDAGPMRYHLLETIREYVAKKLSRSDAETLRDRHLSFYMRLAHAAWERGLTRGTIPERRRLWREIADVRAALDWSRRTPEQHLALATYLYGLWWMFSPTEGLRHLEEALADASPEATLTRGHALQSWSALAGRSGSLRPEDPRLEEYVRLCFQLGDPFLLATLALSAGYGAERSVGELEVARVALTEAVSRFEAGRAAPYVSLATASLGSIEMQLGNYEAARALMQRALDVAIEAEDPYNAVGARFHLGHLALEERRLADARSQFLAALGLADPDDLPSIDYLLEGLACAQAETEPAQALTLFGAAARMRDESATPLGPPWEARVRRAIQDARTGVSGREADSAWATGYSMSAGTILSDVRGRYGKGKRAALPGGLSRRELEIARLVATGMTNRAIAEKLFLAERTVESHMDHIMGKLDLTNRTELASWLIEHGLRTAPAASTK
jgi:predicted ATPase/DNA-binding CsgD family transcriptional regulator